MQTEVDIVSGSKLTRVLIEGKWVIIKREDAPFSNPAKNK